MRRFLYPLIDCFLILGFFLFQYFLSILPEKAKELLGLFMGKISYVLLTERRKVALKNVERVFKDMVKKDREQIVKRSFERLGINFVEMLSVQFLKDLDKRFSVQGGNFILQALKEKRSVILVGFHFSNWEIMGVLPRLLNIKVAVIAKPLKGHKLLNRFLNRLRSKMGLYVLPKKGSLRDTLRYMKDGFPIAVLADQREKRSKGIFVDFFGEMVPTTKVVALLSLRSDAYVIPIYLERKGFLRYTFVVSPALEMEKDGEREELLKNNTRKINKFLEDLVLRYPEEWFWVHRRWKRKEPTSSQ